MGLVSVDQIAERLHVTRMTAWRWSRRGRFGSPVDPLARKWMFEDGESLALSIELCRRKEPDRVWRSQNDSLYHQRRLGRFIAGGRSSDAEDFEMASVLLNITARQFERWAAGMTSPATVSAEFVGRQMLSKNRAGHLLTQKF